MLTTNFLSMTCTYKLCRTPRLQQQGYCHQGLARCISLVSRRYSQNILFKTVPCLSVLDCFPFFFAAICINKFISQSNRTYSSRMLILDSSDARCTSVGKCAFTVSMASNFKIIVVLYNLYNVL